MDAELHALFERGDRAIEESRELKLAADIQHASVLTRISNGIITMQPHEFPQPDETDLPPQ